MQKKLNDFAHKLNRLLDENDMSQSDLARRLWGRSLKTNDGRVVPYGKDRVNQWVKARNLPDEEIRDELCKILKTTRDDLFPGDTIRDLGSSPSPFELKFVSGKPGMCILRSEVILSIDDGLRIGQIIDEAASRYRDM